MKTAQHRDVSRNKSARSQKKSWLKKGKTRRRGKGAAFILEQEHRLGLPSGTVIIAPPDPAAVQQLQRMGLKAVSLSPSVHAAVHRKEWRGRPKSSQDAGRGMKALGRMTEEVSSFPADASAFEPGPKAKALLRGRMMALDDLRNSGGSYTLEQVCDLMHGVSRQRVDKRVRDGSLLAIPGPSNKRRYPVVQFNNDGTVVAGLRDVKAALPTSNDWAVLNFLIRPDVRLNGRKPIDLLKEGRVEPVIEAARRMGEQGA